MPFVPTRPPIVRPPARQLSLLHPAPARAALDGAVAVSWHGPPGSGIETFVATWIVPPRPTRREGQTLDIFIAVLPDAGGAVLRPTLQWGRHPGDPAGETGDFWTVCTRADDHAARSGGHVPVRPGDRLVAVIERQHSWSAGYRYLGWFEDIAGTECAIDRADPFTRRVAALALHPRQRAHPAEPPSRNLYPPTPSIAFTDLHATRSDASACERMALTPDPDGIVGGIVPADPPGARGDIVFQLSDAPPHSAPRRRSPRCAR